MQITSAERVALVGMTGSGKTYFAARLLKPIKRLVVIDPKATLRGKWGLAEWGHKTAKKLKEGDPVRVRFAPEPGEEWRYDEICEQVYRAGNCILYVDEVYGVTPPGKQPPPFFSAVYTRGRELGIGAVAATQRPAWVPLFIFTEADSFVMFRLLLDKDKKRMAEFMGDPVLAPIKDPHGFYFYQVRWAHEGGTVRYYRGVTSGAG